jgi:hypothetical protein
MLGSIRTRIGFPVMLAALLLASFGLAHAVIGGNIDPTDKWAWSTNAGWINFAPSCTGCDGVTVYPDHLEGYAWGESIGWIRLGTHTGGGAHTYANTAAGNYGVNRDVSGHLSGYAWGTNVGWISFDPTHGGVTINMANGEFDGYAWGENTGWIHLKGTAADTTEYKVVARLFRVYLPLVIR